MIKVNRQDLDVWTLIVDEEAYASAVELARGDYQRAILRGREALSGSTLKGRASEYAGRYRRSASTLLDRMTKAGIPWCEVTGTNNRRVLVVGASEVEVVE